MLEPIIYEQPGEIMRSTEERKAVNLYIDCMFLRDYACLFGTKESIPEHELPDDYYTFLDLATQATMIEKLERAGIDADAEKMIVRRVAEELDYALMGKDVLTMTRGQEYVVAPPPLNESLRVRETMDATAYQWNHFLFSCIDRSHVVKQFVVMYDDALALATKFVLPGQNPENEDDFLPRLFEYDFSFQNTLIGDAFLTMLHAAVQTIKREESERYEQTILFGHKRKQVIYDAYRQSMQNLTVLHGLLTPDD